VDWRERLDNVNPKTVLLVDDEQGFLEPLAVAVEYEGFRVLTASTAEDALRILAQESVHLATVDIMIPPGPSFEKHTSSQNAGVWLCEAISKKYPNVDVFCLSVVSDIKTIRKVESFGVKFLRKGETPLRTVLNMMRSRLTGVAFSTDPSSKRR
jgi:DNA-binding response OmpR family regulator